MSDKLMESIAKVKGIKINESVIVNDGSRDEASVYIDTLGIKFILEDTNNGVKIITDAKKNLTTFKNPKFDSVNYSTSDVFNLLDVLENACKEFERKIKDGFAKYGYK